MKSLSICTGLIGNPEIFVVRQCYSSRKSKPGLRNINNFRLIIKGFNQLKSPPAELCSSCRVASVLGEDINPLTEDLQGSHCDGANYG